MFGSKSTATAIVFGALGAAAIPVAVVASRRLSGVTLLEATEVAVGAGFVLGLIAISFARRGRYRVDRSVSRRGARAARIGRLLAWSAIFFAVSGALALGFYGVLVLRG
jgi:hypothetical protein